MEKQNLKIAEAKASISRLKSTPQIYADFPKTEIPTSKIIFSCEELNFKYDGTSTWLWREGLTCTAMGSVRISIEGANGAGKSTLTRLITGQPLKGEVKGSVRLGQVQYRYLDQSLSLIDDDQSVMENALKDCRLDPSTLRSMLAQFLFPGDRVHQRASTLSGGERLRLGLAMVLLADPVSQLLILDEPTNNIDIHNLEFMEVALRKYKGALIVISHDHRFLEAIEIGKRIQLS